MTAGGQIWQSDLRVRQTEDLMAMHSCGTQTSVYRQMIVADDRELLVLLIAIPRLGEGCPLPGSDGCTAWADRSNESYSAEQAADDRRASVLEAM